MISMLMRKWKQDKRIRYCAVATLVLVVFLLFRPRSHRASQLEEKQYVAVDAADVPVDAGGNGKVTLVVLVMTGPKNRDRRDAMRRTWLSRGHFGADDLRHFFVIGTKDLTGDLLIALDEEQQLHRDLMLLRDFKDSYSGLTTKLGLMLELVHREFDFKFVFKVDDDTFATLDVIMRELKNDVEKRDADALYWGFFYGRGRVKKSGPWKEAEWKLCDYYLPYARGGGYLLSRDLVGFVAANWRRFRLYQSEDVSLGAWLAPLKVTRLHDVRFDTEYKSRGCKNAFVVCHKQSVLDMIERDASLKSSGKLCPKEFSNFNGYVYDWDVPPSQCCVRAGGVP